MEECQIAVAQFYHTHTKKLLIKRSDHVSDQVCLSLYKARAVCIFYIIDLLEFVWTSVSASLLTAISSRDTSDLSLPESITFLPHIHAHISPHTSAEATQYCLYRLILIDSTADADNPRRRHVIVKCEVGGEGFQLCRGKFTEPRIE